jgi:thiosulfate dehydrogenase
MCGTRCANLLLAIAGTAFVLICLIASGCSGHAVRAAQAQSANPQQAGVTSRQQADLIHQGKLIFDETPKYAGSYVGNKLACNDCHLQSGTAAYAAPMIDLSGLFPMFNKRAGHVISLQSRIQECFTRSEAGRPLPEDS